MRQVLLVITIIVFSLKISLSAQSLPPTSLVPQEQHSWGKFQPGAWRCAELVGQSFDEDGNVIATTFTKTTTTLNHVLQNGFELVVDTEVTVGHAKLEKPSQVVWQGLSGQSREETITVEVGKTKELRIDGRIIPCETRRILFSNGDQKKQTIASYSPIVKPFLLTQDTSITDPKNEKLLFRTRAEVIALDLPHRVLDETLQVSLVKTVHHGSDGTIITVEAHSDEVPGAVIAHWSKELNNQGVLIQTSTLEIINYGSQSNNRKKRKPTRRKDRGKERNGEL